MSEQVAPRGMSDAVRDALVRIGAGAGDLESVAGPLLDALQALTGLESTYLTSIDWDQQVQRIVLAHDTGALAIGAGLEVPWEDTLCRRAMESGTSATDDVPGLWGDSQAAHELGIRSYVSVPVVLADGQVYGTLCGASSTPVPVDEQTRSLLAVFSRIIADTVARERQLAVASARVSETDRLLRARSQFVAAAQHRLKTPLTVIRGWATLLLDGEDDMEADERRDALQAIARAAANAIHDVGSMLQESETDALARDLAIGPVDVVDVVRRSARDLASLSGDHDIVVEAHPHVPQANTDTEALRIILEHLVENAIKYSPAGGRVDVSIGLSDAGRVMIAVRDEGVGIPVGVDVFAPFTRGPAPSTSGSGLGLHIVQSLVHAVGGEVTARRNEGGRGSTLTVLLPPARRRAV